MITAVGSPNLSAGNDLADLFRPRAGASKRSTSTAKLPDDRPDPTSNADNLRVKPGQTPVLADLNGRAIIRHIWAS